MTGQHTWDYMLRPLQVHFGIEWCKDPGGLPSSPVQCFSLKIPWCETLLNWKVILSCSQNAAPDFVFDDPCFFPLLNKSTSQDFRDLLKNWNISDAACLTKVLAALLGIYRFYHLSKMKAVNDSRLQFELDTMTFGNNTELLLENAKALIGVELTGIDLSSLQDLIEMPGRDAAVTRKHMFMLYVAFPVGSLSSPLTRIKRLQRGIVLLDQLEEVFGHPLERTSGIPQTSCYLVAHMSVFFLLFVEIGIGFPDKKPILSVQNIRKPTINGPVKELAFDRWSPRWSTEEMAVRIATYLKDEANKLNLGGHI